ncbi:MAG: auracyanin family protein [Opitutaceae bacterium]|nr:auracyanin family protein [Opitutaceae bacterium]
MKRLSLLLAAVFAVTLVSRAQTNNPSALERFAKPTEALVAAENRIWQRTPLPIPEGIVLEVSGILPVAGQRLLVTTRRGEVWWIDGAYAADPKPRYTLFAQGLHEPLGIIAAPSGGYYVAQRQELTRLVDSDGDGRADVFETVAKLPISGSYHEYAFGPVLAPNGNLRITLNVAFGGSTQAPVPWRGWMIEITPDGQLTPIASGLRSPAGFTVSSQGAWFTTDNQGEWVGSGKITHIESGDFLGHPAGLAWSKLPGSSVKIRPEDISDFEQPMHVVAQNLLGLKPPAVWLPHTILGISNSGMIEDLSGGKFGPFAGQFYVGDQGQSKLMRVSLEKVAGVWQGAAYSFREGFDSGILRMAIGENATMFVGESARGWGSVGPKQYGIERVTWTGQTPFEIKEIKAQPDGFLLKFTQPVDRATAENFTSYSLAGFTYNYHTAYGAAPVNRMVCPIQKIVVAPDGLSVRLAAQCLREGFIHEVKASGVRAATGGSAVLHPVAYYTLNRLPAGDRIIPIAPNAAELCAGALPASANAHSAKHPIKQPTDWPNNEGDQAFLLGTQPGLKFDQTLLTTEAGTRIRLIFRNTDDMLHNFVLCAPGKGQDVGTAALALGVEGTAKNYVPDSPDVLVHTALTQPETSDTIYFIAPTTPGDYDFICSFPGHSTLMKGILRVTAK